MNKNKTLVKKDIAYACQTAEIESNKIDIEKRYLKKRLKQEKAETDILILTGCFLII